MKEFFTTIVTAWKDVMVALIDKIFDFKVLVLIFLVMGMLKFGEVKELLLIGFNMCK